MTRLVLHIGCEKTGTTSIQSFLTANQARLLEQHRVLYPVTNLLFENSAHFPIAAALLAPELITFLRAERCPDATAVEQALRALAQRSEADRVVISCEHFSSRCRDEAIQRLASFLAPFDVDVLIYVRPQDETAISAWSTEVLAGRRGPLDEASINPQNYYFNIEKIVEAWGQVFGSERIKVRPFQRSQLRGGDVIDDFLCEIGVEDRSGLATGDVLNSSLTRREARLMLALNQHLPTWDEALTADDIDGFWEAADIRRRTLKVMRGRNAPRSRNDTAQLRLTDDWRNRILERFAVSNTRVARYYLGRDQLFAPAPGTHTAPGEPPEADDSEPLSADLAQSLTECVRTLLTAESELRSCPQLEGEQQQSHQQQLHACEAKLEQYRQQVALLTESLSWRITAPLRVLRGLVGRIAYRRQKTR